MPILPQILLQNLKIQANVIETAWKSGVGDLFWAAAAFIQNLPSSPLKKKHSYGFFRAHE